MARLSPASIRLEVPGPLAGERVDRALALLLGWTRADVATVVGNGDVLVDGRRPKPSLRLAEHSVIEVLAEPLAAGPIEAVEMALDIRYEDDDVIVVSKPAGLVVHPGAGREAATLAAGLLARYPRLAAVGDPSRPGIVHRLDRGTSGLLVVAASPPAYEALVAMFAARAVDRTYLALVWGRVAAPRGRIDAPVGRDPVRRTRMAVRAGAREARTEYEVLERFDRPEATLVRCHLATGRTHQVRVHFAAIGHPVVGDATYGGARSRVLTDRCFLHAAALGFSHPVSGGRLAFEDPLPDDLEEALATFERSA